VPDAETQNVEDLAVEVAYWRERALAAEARVEELVAQVATLAEQVATLSKMLFGRSSEKKPGHHLLHHHSLTPPAIRHANEDNSQGQKAMVVVITHTWKQKTFFTMLPKTRRTARVVALPTHCLVTRPVSRLTGS
jgi:hypothetical protein